MASRTDFEPTAFDELVLVSILRLGEASYGVPLREEIEHRTGRAPSYASVYGSLNRLEEAGLLVSDLTDPEPVRGGRARRIYALTEAGRTAVLAAQKQAMRIWGDVAHLVEEES